MHLTRTILPNGATLLLIESHQAPVCYFSIGLRVGSRYENDSESGLSHMLEHMLFKGTAKLKVGELAKIIEGSGGDVNAYTSFDETVYYATFSSRYWERSLEALSDSVLNAALDPQELAREQEVVVEEILRGKDSPNRCLSQGLFEQVYQKHPYGRPIIGTEEKVRGFSRKQVWDFYQKHYIAPNMVVLLAGDFPAKKAYARLEKIFGSLAKKTAPKEKIIKEPKQNKARSLVLTKEIQSYNLALAFPGPSLKDQDLPCLDLLSHILGEGEGSRLDMEVKEKKQLVHSVYSHVFSPAQPGLFMLGATLEGPKVEKALSAIHESIQKIQNQGIGVGELQRAKLNIKSDAIYEKETIQGFSRKYAYYESILGHYDFEQRYYQAIEECNAAEVQQIAQNYLDFNKLNLALLRPQKRAFQQQSKKLLKAYQGIKKQKIQKPRSNLEPQWVTLKNGFRLIFQENHLIPTFVLRSAHLGGLRVEKNQENGIHYLFSQLWARSTAKYNSFELARTIEKTAGSLEAYTGKNLSGLRGDFLSDKMDQGLDLFLDALLHPSIEGEGLNFEKMAHLEAIKREKDQPSQQCFRFFFEALYPKHPYGRSMLGKEANVRAWKQKDLLHCHQNLLNPKESVLAIVGDFDTQELLDQLGPLLEKLKPSKKQKQTITPDPAPKQKIFLENFNDKLQAHIIVGFRGLTFYDQERYALDILNNLLSGQGGRLFLELRDKMSLAYTVTTVNQEGLEPGYFGIYMGTEGSKVEKALEGIEKELKKLLAGGIKKEEVARAKRALVGGYEMEIQRKSMIATQLAFNEVYGLARDEWQALPQKILQVPHQAIEDVARKIIQPDKAIISVLRPKAKA
ncbi:MAG: insulinase family protein [Deltaproteobacteria bacterium]|nr:insulinase family protein [Deltaproteobacteria bacterium]